MAQEPAREETKPAPRIVLPQNQQEPPAPQAQAPQIPPPIAPIAPLPLEEKQPAGSGAPKQSKKPWFVAGGAVLLALALAVTLIVSVLNRGGDGGVQIDDGSRISFQEEDEGEIPAVQEQVGVELHQVDSRAFPQVTLYASLLDSLGNPLDTLGREDVRVYETDDAGNEHEMVVEEVFRVVDSGTVSINLVIDRSGSMETDDAMWQAKSAATQFLGKVDFGGGDMVALTSFDDYVYVDEDFSGDSFTLGNSISAIEPMGTTALYDAIYAALLTTHAQNGAKCVIAFTDGYENASSYALDDVANLSESTGIPVHIIGVGYDTDEATLMNLAARCGGTYYHADTLGLDEALGDIYASIYAQQQEWFGIRYTSTFTDALSSARQVAVDMNRYKGFTGTSTGGSYTPQAVIDSNFAGTYGHVDKELVYDLIVQFVTRITRGQGAGSHDKTRLAQLAADQPAMLDVATALSGSDRESLDIGYSGVTFEYMVTLDDFGRLMDAVFGGGAPYYYAEDFLGEFSAVRNPNVYSYNGNSWFIAYTSVFDALVLGRPDTADTSRAVNYVVAATQNPGSYTAIQIDILQFVLCRGEYRDNGFFASANGEVYAVLDKYGETEITKEEYEALLAATAYADMQQLIGDLIQRYGVTGAECRIDAGTYGSMEEAFLEGVTMESSNGPAGMTETEALVEAGFAFRGYYESFLDAIYYLDSSHIEYCTENQRRRQDARIFEFNKDYTFENKNLRIDADTVELVYENGRHTLRFNIRCENDMWKREQGADREDNVSHQIVEMYYDEARGSWIVASTDYDNEMDFGGNLFDI